MAELAEGHHHGLLPFLHDEEAAAQPDQDDHTDDQAGAQAGTLHVGRKLAVTTRPALTLRSTLAAEQAAQLAIEVAPQFVEIGRTLVATATTGALVAGGLVALRLGSEPPAGIVQIEEAAQA